ncbi:ATP synthase F1 subunit delta [Poriferisphaera sp. WC338]|uniref:ATP synthase F1 subunit delta n=1 Tax=Poriferisphaera sp. WC338 TaxID=3425129 RepID=UPI003D8153A8
MAVKKQAMTDAVSEVYAQALIEIAEASGELETVAAELQELGNLLANDTDLTKVLQNRALSERERGGFIERVFKDRFSDSVYKFLRVVNAKDRLGSLPGIITAYSNLLRDKKNIVSVKAWVAQEMNADEAATVSRSIGESLGGKTVELEQEVDADLIGGLKIRVGDKMIDASVASQLRLMKQKLVEAGREQARQKAATL